MAVLLIELANTDRYWLQVDDADPYNTLKLLDKVAIEADIAAINATLALPQYPEPTQVDQWVAWILANIPAAWPAETRAEAARLTNAMHAAYTGNDASYLEAAQLIAKRDALVELLAKLV